MYSFTTCGLCVAPHIGHGCHVVTITCTPLVTTSTAEETETSVLVSGSAYSLTIFSSETVARIFGAETWLVTTVHENTQSS